LGDALLLCTITVSHSQGDNLVRSNYSFKKRQKELARKKKKEEKRAQKLAKSKTTEEEVLGPVQDEGEN
jgi:hypothetical protein